MPPHKRKAPSKAATPASKKVRTADSSVVDEPEEALPTRPKRKAVGTPQYNFTRPRRTLKKQADSDDEVEEAVAPEPEPPKRRGRPPKTPIATTTVADVAPTARAATRGRPATKTVSNKTSVQQTSPKATEHQPSGKKRGRLRKLDAADVQVNAPAKGKSSTKKQATPKVTKTPGNATQSAATKGTAAPRKRGRPRKSSQTQNTASLVNLETADIDDLDGEETDENQADHQYWLMKAEPNDRFENGVNVKFSIDDLAAAEAPEPWDGVRNYGARNNMRAMRKGDLAFFYHSNCQVPGIVGVMRIVQEHSPDKSAFNPKHPYYDPKSSPSNPKWDCVHVEFVKKFDSPVTLKMLQEIKNSSGELGSMQLLKMGRLSVSAVSAKEWRFILKMANEDLQVGESDKPPAQTDGYEADTDGEVDVGPKEELNGDMAAAVQMDIEAEMATTSDSKDVAEELTAEEDVQFADSPE